MTQVVAHQAKFEAANINVVIVSFSTLYWSQVWLKETQSPFPFLMDPGKHAYRAYQLESSVIRSWSPSTLWYYAKAKLNGRETMEKRGDPHQLGGDFLVTPQGKIKMSHPSASPTDRPSLDELIAAIH